MRLNAGNKSYSAVVTPSREKFRYASKLLGKWLINGICSHKEVDAVIVLKHVFMLSKRIIEISSVTKYIHLLSVG